MKNNNIQNNEEKVLKCKAIFKIPAGAASAKAPLGPALGQYGIPIAEFCTRYNTLTEQYKAGTVLKALVNLYEDNTYDITIQNPDAAFFIKMAMEHDENFSTKKNNKIRGKSAQKYKDIIPTNMLFEIADEKYNGGLNKIYSSIKPLYKSLLGTSRSMGIIVVPYQKRNYSTNNIPNHHDTKKSWGDWYNYYIYPYFTQEYHYVGYIAVGVTLIVIGGVTYYYWPKGNIKELTGTELKKDTTSKYNTENILQRDIQPIQEIKSNTHIETNTTYNPNIVKIEIPKEVIDAQIRLTIQKKMINENEKTKISMLDAFRLGKLNEVEQKEVLQDVDTMLNFYAQNRGNNIPEYIKVQLENVFETYEDNQLYEKEHGAQLEQEYNLYTFIVENLNYQQFPGLL